MIEEITPIPVEEQITNELVKANVTEAKISELREKYLPLKINGIEDKENYLLVKEGRKDCKGWRVLAEKLCKKGREEAVAIQKAWVAKEKDVTSRIGEVEDYLEKQEKDYEAAVEAEKQRRKREQEEQLIMRQQALSSMGVVYDNGNFILGDVSFEMSVIKECDSEIWENDIKPRYEEEFKKVEAERIEQERIKQEKEAELKKQQEEMERRERELAEKEAALKAAQEEQERKQREEGEKKAAEEKAARESKQKARMDQMYALGLKYDFSDNHFKGYDCFVSNIDIITYDDEKWVKTVNELTSHIASKKEEEEQKRQSEIEAQKEAERVKILGTSRMEVLKQYNADTQITIEKLGAMPDVDWEIIRSGWQDAYEKDQREKWEQEQEEKRKAEELKKQLEMEQAKDKEKWEDILAQINKLEIHEMRSGQYRKKAFILREKLDEIKSL